MYSVEELQSAIDILKKLSREKNPLTGEWIKDWVFHDARIKERLKLAFAVLEEVVENGGEVVSVTKPVKFKLSEEMFKSVKLTSKPVSVSEFIKNVNETVNADKMQKLTAAPIHDWLSDSGYIRKRTKKVTRNTTEYVPAAGAYELGITAIEEVIKSTGEIKHCIALSSKAQVFILEHLEEILAPKESEYAKKFEKPKEGFNGRGGRWSEEEEAQLKAEFTSGENVDVIAVRHGRSSYAIWLRLQKMELVKEDDE